MTVNRFQDIGLEQSLYEELFNQSHDGILLVCDGVIARANDAFCRLHGYEESEIIGKSPVDLVRPEDREIARDRIAAFLRGEIPSASHVYRSQHRDGTSLDVEVTTRLVHFETQPILQVIVRNLGEVRAARAALDEAETRYRTLFESIPIGIYQTTPDGRILEANQALVDMLGYPDRETLLATPVESGYADPGARRTWQERIEQESIIAGSEAVWRTYDGDELWVEEHARAVRDENGIVLCYEGTAQDISERKTIEMALDRERAYFEQLFSNAPEAVVLCDNEGMVQQTNREFRTLFGYEDSETVGRHIDDLVARNGEAILEEASSITCTVTSGVATTIETVRRCKDGSSVHVSLLAQPIFVHGRQAGLYAIYRDIGARVKAQRALRESRGKVEGLHAAAARLERAENRDEIYRITIETAEAILGFTYCALDIVQKGQLDTHNVSSRTPKDRIRRTRIADAASAGRAFREGRTLVETDISPGEQSEWGAMSIRSLLTSPIHDIGVFQVASENPDTFTEEDARFLEILLGHTAEAASRVQLQRELQDQATHDALTGVYNRRYFNDVLEHEVLRATRYDHPIGLLMIDVNDFKEINDSRGHQVGDLVLQAIAEILVASVRETDFIVRYGGDEFLVVLAETGEETELAAKRISSEVGASEVLRNLAGQPVTLSVGAVAWSPESDIPVEAALASADERMYEEKGRR